MSKQSYKIPESLDKSWGDVEVPVVFDNGIGSDKPLQMKTILAFVGSVMLWFLIISKTPVAAGGLLTIIPFTIVFALLAWIMIKSDKSGEMGWRKVPTLMTYLPPANRRLFTRKDDNARGFVVLSNLQRIDSNSGLITFADGSYGFMYQVVGSASTLLFEQDEHEILDRVDRFYRKMHKDCEIIIITTKEPQYVYKQLAFLKMQYDRLQDPDLIDLANMRFDVLKDEVGGQYRSMHQYMILKATNKEELMLAKNILQAEVEGSSLMFKSCVSLDGDGIARALSAIYMGKESL